MMLWLSLVMLRLLARLIAGYPVPWMLEQEGQVLTPEERLLLADLLPAWHAGMRLRGGGEKARGP